MDMIVSLVGSPCDVPEAYAFGETFARPELQFRERRADRASALKRIRIADADRNRTEPHHVWAMPMSRIGALSAALSMAAACGSVVPTAPGAPSPGSGLVLTCNAPTPGDVAGDIVVCLVRAASVNVSIDAVWMSSDPNIVTSLGTGAFVAKSGGQATLTTSELGRSGPGMKTSKVPLDPNAALKDTSFPGTRRGLRVRTRSARRAAVALPSFACW